MKETKKLKKVTLGHLSRKHNMSIDELRTLFVEEGLMKKNARKVTKKPAKELIRAFQSADAGWLWIFGGITNWFRSNKWSYPLIGALALLSLFGYLGAMADEWRTADLIEASAIVQESGAEDHGSAFFPDTNIVLGGEQALVWTIEVSADQNAVDQEEFDHAAASSLPKTWADLSTLK